MSLPTPPPAGDEHAERLDPERCLALLASVSRGQLAASVRAMPAVMPARHTVDGGLLHVRCPDEAFLRACGGAVVAFAADAVDERLTAGWFVQVVGEGELAVDGATGAPVLRITPRLFDGRALDG